MGVVLGAPNTDFPALNVEVPNAPAEGSVAPNPNPVTELEAVEKLGLANPDPNTLPPVAIGCSVFSSALSSAFASSFFSAACPKIGVLVCPKIDDPDGLPNTEDPPPKAEEPTLD